MQTRYKPYVHPFQSGARVFPRHGNMHSLSVHIHCSYTYTVSQKNRTPITFWNNSNKLCLIIIMISWENRQKVLNIVVCYGLTIFHKTGYQLRMNWSSAWWGLVWPMADRCQWRNRWMEKTSPSLCSSKGTALWTSAVTSDYDVANQQFVQLQTLAL